VKVDIEQRILAANDELAGSNRRLFAEHGVFVLDLMASPAPARHPPFSPRSQRCATVTPSQ